MGALGHWHQTMILSTASSRRQSTRSSASRRKVARPASQRSGWPGELAGLLRSLKATLKLGPGNTKLVADALRHGLGSWPELASSGDARAGASRECGRRLPPRKVGRPNGIAILRLSRQFARAGDLGMPLLGAWAAGSAEHARDMPVLASSGRGARHGRFPLEPIRRAESHGNSTPETDGVWPRGCCVSRARRRRAATCQPPKSAAAAGHGFASSWNS